MDGYNRIKELYLSSINKDKSLMEIVRYLMKRQGMNELYLNEDKNLDDMMKYIRNRAKEHATNNVACVPDTEVYQWATDYFTQSNEELGITTKVNNTKQETQDIPKETSNQLSLEIK